MPKLNFRYKHMDRRGGNSSGVAAFQPNVTRSDLLVSTPPRKVSFEDSRNDSDLSICSDDTVPTKNKKTMQAGETTDSEPKRRRPIGRKRSLLVRPVTSLSLVDLAKSVAQDGVSPVTSERNNGDMIEGRNSKRSRSFNVSPRSVVHASDLSGVNREIFSSLQPSSEGESKSIRASPWGHFIDMAPDEDENFDLPRSSYPSYYYNCSMVKKGQRGVAVNSCKDSLCRLRRRPSPYGEYKSYAIRVDHPTLSFVGLRTDMKSKRTFRLSPRKSERTHRSADELIGVFSELQVRHAEQNY